MTEAGVLLGVDAPGEEVDRWWCAESSIRSDALREAAVCLEGVSDQAIRKVVSHPAVGLLARSTPDESPGSRWNGTVAALLLESGDQAAALTALRRTEQGEPVHLPGARVVFESGTLRQLPVMATIEINPFDLELRKWADTIDETAPVSAQWLELVEGSKMILGAFDCPDIEVVNHFAHVIVPLVQRDGRLVGRPEVEIESGSVTGAVGALYLSPGDYQPVLFAEALVHESFHQLLNALVLTTDLVLSASTDQLLPSPWKPLPRPPLAVLHGVVAFSSVIRFWLRVSNDYPEWSAFGRHEAVRRTEQVLAACGTLLSAGVLTGIGIETVLQAINNARALI